MDIDDIALEPITIDDLRADKSGILIKQIASLAYRAFRDPPWADDAERPRLHLGLGVDLMRRCALALIAKDKGSGKIAGYSVGYEVFLQSDDPRDLTLSAIAGTKALDYLFNGGHRVFYGDTLCVDRAARRRRIGYRLAAAQIPILRGWGFAYRIGRTATSATAMRALYLKLGFEELPLHDAVLTDRTYWLLCL